MNGNNSAYVGISDRTLYWSGSVWRVGYVGFWDYDHPFPPPGFRDLVRPLGRNIAVIKSGRGFHFVAFDITGRKERDVWLDFWHVADPSADYPRNVRDNYLRLTAKNSVLPVLSWIECFRPLPASRVHLRAFRQILGSDFRRFAPYVFSPIVPSQGLIRFYGSDPNGAFEHLES